MANPKWNKDRRMWVIQGKKNGLRKNFYSFTPGLKGKKEVVSKYEDWLEFGGIEKVTVEKCVDLYLKDIESRLGKGESYREAEIYSRLYILPALGKAKMNNLTIRDWQGILNEARPHSDRIESLSHKTLTHLRSVIVGLHKFAYNNYFCDAWRGELYIPKGHKKGEKEILQPSDIRNLFVPSELWFYPCFLIMLLCGLRPGEALGLQVNDLGEGVLYISRSINDNGEITSGKNKNARRIVPLPLLAEQIIRQTIARNENARLETEWVFPNGSGGQPCQDTVRKQWNKLKEERNLPGTLYSLRHTFVSIVSSQTHLAEGTLKSIVGHSESMQTFTVYKHRVDSEIEQASKIINLTFERIAENS